jgi:hypothetical protein
MAERFVHVNSDQSVAVSDHQPIATVMYRGWWRTHRVARYSPGRLTAYTSQADELAIALIEAGLVVGMQ